MCTKFIENLDHEEKDVSMYTSEQHGNVRRRLRRGVRIMMLRMTGSNSVEMRLPDTAAQ